MLKVSLFLFSLSISIHGFSQAFALATTKEKVFYQWVENPFQVVVENVACKNLVIAAEKGKLVGSNCDYTYTACDSVFEDIIKIGIKKRGKIKWLLNQTVRVNSLPTPDITLGAYQGNGDSLSKFNLAYAYKLNIFIYDFDFFSYLEEDRQVVNNYTVTVFRGNEEIFKETIDTNLLSESYTKFMMDSVQENDKVIIDNIGIVLYRKEKRQIDQVLWFIVKEKTEEE
jgi:hypothetical protein